MTRTLYGPPFGRSSGASFKRNPRSASTGEDLLLDDFRNYTRMYTSQVAGLERAANRASIANLPWQEDPCYMDRSGTIYIPNRILTDLRSLDEELGVILKFGRERA